MLRTAIGLVAAFCASLSYLPQVIKCWKTGETEDLSLGMLVLLTTVLSLWIAYGVLKGDWVIIGANVRDGVLYVIGNDSANSIQVNRLTTGQTQVVADFVPGGYVTTNATAIVVQACGGNDSVLIASAMCTKCSKNFEAMSSMPGSNDASSRAIASMVPQ